MRDLEYNQRPQDAPSWHKKKRTREKPSFLADLKITHTIHKAEAEDIIPIRNTFTIQFPPSCWREINNRAPQTAEENSAKIVKGLKGSTFRTLLGRGLLSSPCFVESRKKMQNPQGRSESTRAGKTPQTKKITVTNLFVALSNATIAQPLVLKINISPPSAKKPSVFHVVLLEILRRVPDYVDQQEGRSLLDCLPAPQKKRKQGAQASALQPRHPLTHSGYAQNEKSFAERCQL